MIPFHDDHLVPPELCRLLHQVVPKEYHVPVRFHNHRKRDLHATLYPLGSFSRTKSPHIDINLNPIYRASCREYILRDCAPSTAVWRRLLGVCLHEFGHCATRVEAERMNQYEYDHENGGRVYEATEKLANDWMDRQTERILRWDSRLVQPRYITGYLGARIAKWYVAAKEMITVRGRPDFLFVKERRCRDTGGQLSSGDVLRLLDIELYNYTNVYEVLRRISTHVGIDYVDAAGRHHKLYTWGDVPDLAQRLRDGSWALREAQRSRAYDAKEAYHALPHEEQEEDFEDIPF